MSPSGPTEVIASVLLVEDSADDAELILRALGRSGIVVHHRRVETAADLVDALEAEWDVAIADFSMPQFDGLRAFEIIREHEPEMPVVFVSDVMGEERAVAAMRIGAKDYVLKSKIDRLALVVRRELAQATARRERRFVEDQLRLEQMRYQGIFNSTSVAMAELDFSGAMRLVEGIPAAVLADRLTEEDPLVWAAADLTMVVAVNAACTKLMDASRAGQVIGPVAAVLRKGSRATWLQVLRAVMERPGQGFQAAVQMESLKGQIRDVLLTFQVPDRNSELKTLVLSAVNISERVSLERQMRAAQRLEAVGRLAGGVAHDFNNALTVIHSATSLLLATMSPEAPEHRDVLVIQRAATRAEGLTRQLLAFSRRQMAEKRVLDLNRVVVDVEHILERLLGEDVAIKTFLADDLGLVEADPGHIEQILMNLAVNARDAMPHGGKLTIETSNTDVDAAYAATKPADVPAGDFVTVSVSDDGIGMDEETQQRIFEPFFTTKGEGRGTGLGLAMVYGLVKQAGGFVWVYSEVGVGTVFRIHLPRKLGNHESYVPPSRPSRISLTGTETIMLVEDQEDVREAVQRTLEDAGYSLLTAVDGQDALDKIANHDGRLHAVITDVVMPTMSGRELAERLGLDKPDLKVLFMSGYTNDGVVRHGVLEGDVEFIQKPFTPDTLLLKLREVLDADS